MARVAQRLARDALMVATGGALSYSAFQLPELLAPPHAQAPEAVEGGVRVVAAPGPAAHGMMHRGGDLELDHGLRPLGGGVHGGAPPRTEQLRVMRSFISSVNYRTRQPNWVAEHLTSSTMRGDSNRKHSYFKPDAAVPEPFRAKLDDYRKSGYSRGHMATASSHKATQEELNETFLLSANIVPQEMSNNGGDWLRLERFSQDLTADFDHVRVLSGPLWLPEEREDGRRMVEYQVLGDSNVAVPTHLFKIIAVENEGGKEAAVAGFVLPNGPTRDHLPLPAFQVPVPLIESMAGIRLNSTPLGEGGTPALESGKEGGPQDLCVLTGCKYDGDIRIQRWQAFGRIKVARSVAELEAAWRHAQELGFDQPWVREMYETEYEARKAHFQGRQPDQVAAGAGTPTALHLVKRKAAD